jgi:pimeloyl-ACP methyl ester carboxylesterase
MRSLWSKTPGTPYPDPAADVQSRCPCRVDPGRRLFHTLRGRAGDRGEPCELGPDRVIRPRMTGASPGPDREPAAGEAFRRSSTLPRSLRFGLDMHIPVSHGRLEAQLREAEGPVRGCAVICHPHPLFGGTMHTKAVFRTAQALNEIGFHALRFNFRGVGTSTGEYGEGRAEEEDVEAALDWVGEAYPELPQLLGGFSFGSMVALRVGVRDQRPQALLGLGLAVDSGTTPFSGTQTSLC